MADKNMSKGAKEASLELLTKEANGCTVSRKVLPEKKECPKCKVENPNLPHSIEVTEHESEGVKLWIMECTRCRFKTQRGRVPKKKEPKKS